MNSTQVHWYDDNQLPQMTQLKIDTTIIKAGAHAQQSCPSLLVMREPDGANWFIALFHGDGKRHELTFPRDRELGRKQCQRSSTTTSMMPVSMTAAAVSIHNDPRAIEARTG